MQRSIDKLWGSEKKSNGGPIPGGNNRSNGGPIPGGSAKKTGGKVRQRHAYGDSVKSLANSVYENPKKNNMTPTPKAKPTKTYPPEMQSKTYPPEMQSSQNSSMNQTPMNQKASRATAKPKKSWYEEAKDYAGRGAQYAWDTAKKYGPAVGAVAAPIAAAYISKRKSNAEDAAGRGLINHMGNQGMSDEDIAKNYGKVADAYKYVPTPGNHKRGGKIAKRYMGGSLIGGNTQGSLGPNYNPNLDRNYQPVNNAQPGGRALLGGNPNTWAPSGRAPMGSNRATWSPYNLDGTPDMNHPSNSGEDGRFKKGGRCRSKRENHSAGELVTGLARHALPFLVPGMVKKGMQYVSEIGRKEPRHGRAAGGAAKVRRGMMTPNGGIR